MYTFSPTCSKRESITKNTAGPELNDHNNSSMTNSVMVSRLYLDVSKSSSSTSRKEESFKRSSRELLSSDAGKFSKTNVLDSFMESQETEGVSRRTSDLTNSRCTGLLKYYELGEANVLAGVGDRKCVSLDVI